jgi:lysophospholipase L1-like esterase
MFPIPPYAFGNPAAMGGFIGVLDAVPGALAAWGLVPLKTSFIGQNGFKLRRTADSATSDFAFTSPETPASAVEAWKGPETTWNARKAVFDTVYDQVSTNHITQATTTAQPGYLQLPTGRVVAALNGDNLARDAFFNIPNASWNGRNLTIYHVMLPNERTWSGSSAWLGINHLNFGWTVTGGYAGLSATSVSGTPPAAIARMWRGGSFDDNVARLSNCAVQTLAIRYNGSNTLYSINDTIQLTTPVQVNGTLTNGAIGRLANFALFSTHQQWVATIIYPAQTDAEMDAVFAALRSQFGTAVWTHNVVFDGDSITAGLDESEGFFDVRYKSWPAELHSLIGDHTLRFSNLAIASKTLANLETEAAAKVDTVYSASLFGTNNILVLFAGTNDINAGASGATAISRLTTYFNNRRTAGWNKIVLCTSIPRENFNSTQNADLATYNAFIKANTLGADAVVALDELGWSFSTDYQGTTPNRIHPNATGRAKIYNAVRPVLESLL